MNNQVHSSPEASWFDRHVGQLASGVKIKFKFPEFTYNCPTAQRWHCLTCQSRESSLGEPTVFDGKCAAIL